MMAVLEATPVLCCFYLPSLVASFPQMTEPDLVTMVFCNRFPNQERIAYARCSFGMRWSPPETACITEIDSREDAFIYEGWGRVKTASCREDGNIPTVRSGRGRKESCGVMICT